jgi:lysophospholipase L1-like esterase
MFLGDSITHGWEDNPPNGGKEVWREKLTPYRPQNFGIGGDETSHVLWRLRNGNLDGKADPKLVVLMIGTNDTAANRPTQRVAKNIKAIIAEIQTRKPDAKVLLLAIFPRSPSADSARRVANGKINDIIQGFADNQRVFYKDIGAIFLKPEGKMDLKLLPDKLHPNAAGYVLWADAILPDIKRILGSDYALAPVPPPAAPPQPVAPTAESRKNDKNWIARHKLLNERATEGDFDVMFLGDSITQAWEDEGKAVWAEKLLPFKSKNFGISGDAVRHVLWRLRNGNLDGKADPKLVVLMIGTNDTGKKGKNDPRSTALGVRAIVDEIQKRKPNAKILILGVFPRGKSAQDVARLTNGKINELIQKYADNQRVFYKDLSSLFLKPDGSVTAAFKPDALHLTPAGYVLWADAILPDIERLLKAKP